VKEASLKEPIVESLTTSPRKLAALANKIVALFKSIVILLAALQCSRQMIVSGYHAESLRMVLLFDALVFADF
jgi:hypothetical protein